MEWMFLPLKRYADFSGRSRRKEYLMFTVLMIITTLLVSFTLQILIGSFLLESITNTGYSHRRHSNIIYISAYGTITIIFILFVIFFIPSLAVQVRRFHDLDKSGWFILLNFIPYIGPIIVLAFMCMEGTRGPNGYGEDPKAGEPSH